MLACGEQLLVYPWLWLYDFPGAYRGKEVCIAPEAQLSECGMRLPLQDWSPVWYGCHIWRFKGSSDHWTWRLHATAANLRLLGHRPTHAPEHSPV